MPRPGRPCASAAAARGSRYRSHQVTLGLEAPTVNGHDTTREQDLNLGDLYLDSVEERANAHASPLFAADLRGIAPAYIMNAEFDPRRDECEAFAARLQDAGCRQRLGRCRAISMGRPGLIKEDWPPAQAWRKEANDVLAQVNRDPVAWTSTTSPASARET